MVEVSFSICSLIKLLFGREDKSRESKLAGVVGMSGAFNSENSCLIR